MAGIWLTSLMGLAILAIYLKISKWRHNYRNALKTGFPVFYSPIHLSSVWWMVLYPFLVPILERMPRSWTSPWLQLAQLWKVWNAGHQPFAEAGCDTFVLATPGGNMLWTSDNSMILQLFKLQPKAEQAVELMKFWDIWGPTVFTVSGEEWKAHRRALSAGFGNAMNRVVWEESQHHTETLATHWIEKENSVIPVIRHWTLTLALHVISSGFFNKRLEWDDYGTPSAVPAGHQMPLDKALITLLDRLMTVALTPRSILGRLPGKMFRESSLAFTEVTKYLQELRQSAVDNIEEMANKRHKSLLEAIVLSAADPEITGKTPLSEESVMGNIFFTLLAGHETAGGTLGFIFTLLAIYPEYQQLIQKQLDEQLGSRPRSEWTIERDYMPLQKGFLGAVQKEVLYLYNPASFAMRRIVEPVTLVDSQGCYHPLPENMYALFNFAGAARNPKQWQRPQVSVERCAALSDSPALYFNPERWLGVDDMPDNSEDEGQKVPDWFVFGAGGRACPGRAFAQIELTAVMATLFKDYSLELIVNEKVLQECEGNKQLAWEKVRDEAIRMLYVNVDCNISIRFEKELPIRIVKREAQI